LSQTKDPKPTNKARRSSRRFKLLKSKRTIFYSVGVGLTVFIVTLPLMAGTQSYPVAIVNGNSMYPTLHNGDLVFFEGAHGPIKNGTIIVFVQGQSGISVLDSVLHPVLIHRVISIGREPDGMTYYQTKGDNNLQPDPFVTDSSNVLGVAVFVVPFAGFPFQFIGTAFGMVVLSCVATLFFLSGVDTKMEQENDKKRLIALFARHSLNGEISPKQFERLQLAVEFYDDIPTDLLSDPTIISTVDWLKGGGLFTKWKEEMVECTDCRGQSFRIVGGGKSFLICPTCEHSQQSRN
jgi:signal peptidase I